MRKESREASRLNRRQFFQIVAVAGVAGVLWRSGVSLDKLGLHTIRRSQAMMGTGINFIVCGPDKKAAQAAVDGSINRMLALEKLLSRHRQESELSRLNRHGIVHEASADFLAVLRESERVSELTGGAFDITVLPLIALFEQYTSRGQLPEQQEIAQVLDVVDYRNIVIREREVSFARPGMGITLDGVGKGYIVDQGINALAEYGFSDVYLEAGGDLMVKGLKEGEVPWKIGVKNPRPSHPTTMITMGVSNAAVATSGDYLQYYSEDLRYHHIINPHSGISPRELASATVMAPTVMEADALATGSMVLGSAKSLALFQKLSDREGLFIDKNSVRYRTKGFAV